MPKSKNRKNHKSKVQKRNARKENIRKELERRRANQIKQLIEKEKESGSFDNVETFDKIDGGNDISGVSGSKVSDSDIKPPEGPII